MSSEQILPPRPPSHRSSKHKKQSPPKYVESHAKFIGQYDDMLQHIIYLTKDNVEKYNTLKQLETSRNELIDKLNAADVFLKMGINQQIDETEKDILHIQKIIKGNDTDLEDIKKSKKYKTMLANQELIKTQGFGATLAVTSSNQYDIAPKPPSKPRPHIIKRHVHVSPSNGGKRARTRKHKKTRSRK